MKNIGILLFAIMGFVSCHLQSAKQSEDLNKSINIDEYILHVPNNFEVSYYDSSNHSRGIIMSGKIKIEFGSGLIDRALLSTSMKFEGLIQNDTFGNYIRRVYSNKIGNKIDFAMIIMDTSRASEIIMKDKISNLELRIQNISKESQQRLILKIFNSVTIKKP